MSLKIDTKKINIENSNVDGYIKEYNDNCSDIYSEISKLSSYWKDDDSAIFLDKMVKEQEKSLSVSELLTKINNFYKEVKDIYIRNNIIEDNSKLEFDDKYIENVTNNLDNIISSITDINNTLYNTYIPYNFYYKNTFTETKNNLRNDKNKLDNYKRNINNYIGKIEQMEAELLTKINEIEEITISSFE